MYENVPRLGAPHARPVEFDTRRRRAYMQPPLGASSKARSMRGDQPGKEANGFHLTQQAAGNGIPRGIVRLAAFFASGAPLAACGMNFRRNLRHDN
jgi:hypothetical protein